MSIERAEQLKREWTDRRVVVKKGVPELKRFQNLVGIVRTVNMNCKMLIQFETKEDISWYDIDPAYIEVAKDEPVKVQETETVAENPPETPAPEAPTESQASAPVASTPPASAAALSPLELARQQGAGKTAAAPVAESGEKKLSPLELARQQGSGQPPTPTAEPTEKKLSPLELARQQGAVEEASKPPAFHVGSAATEESAAEDTTEPDSAAPVETEDLPGTTDPPKAEKTSSSKKRRRPRPNDLKIIEGIGLKIEELLHNADIKTWAILSETDPEKIKQILREGGSRFQMHDPSSWPHQAQLAAEGKFDELEEYQDKLKGGREVE